MFQLLIINLMVYNFEIVSILWSLIYNYKKIANLQIFWKFVHHFSTMVY